MSRMDKIRAGIREIDARQPDGPVYPQAPTPGEMLIEGDMEDVDRLGRLYDWTPEERDHVAALVAEARATFASARSEQDRLAEWVLANCPGEPSQDGGVVDTVIRLIGSARADGAAEADRVRKLHHVETVMTVRPGCGEDGDCAHEDDCPEDNPVQLCAACREQMEIADAYWTEKSDAWAVVLWPCSTARALDGSS